MWRNTFSIKIFPKILDEHDKNWFCKIRLMKIIGILNIIWLAINFKLNLTFFLIIVWLCSDSEFEDHSFKDKKSTTNLHN